MTIKTLRVGPFIKFFKFFLIKKPLLDAASSGIQGSPDLGKSLLIRFRPTETRLINANFRLVNNQNRLIENPRLIRGLFTKVSGDLTYIKKPQRNVCLSFFFLKSNDGAARDQI